jgi:twitching motility protein PilT
MAKGQPISKRMDHTPEIDMFFKATIKAKASNLHLKAGQMPKMRINNKLKNVQFKSMKEAVLSEETVENLVFEIISEEQKSFFLGNGSLTFAYQVGEMDRFHVNIFRQRGSIRLAARHISGHIPPFASLHLPPIVEKIAECSSGLVLVTGPAKCGKSTTIASMINYINHHRACHIVTIEDPIEFLHVDDKAIVSQREIGVDVPSYDDALKSLMSQDPDVILIGEMRDQDTITAAMRAAEMGHLIFGTLHAASASQAIQRILDLFTPDERALVRQTFAQTMQAIISQVLLPGTKAEARRIPAVEILINNSSARKLILEERESGLPNVIASCQSEGMVDFTESLRKLVMEEWIDLRVARQYAPNTEELDMALKGIRPASSGIL